MPEGSWWDGEGDCSRGRDGFVQCSGSWSQEQAVGQSSKICCPTVPPEVELGGPWQTCVR